MGEISVLVAAATGIASLIFVQTRNARLSRATAKNLPPTEPTRGTWLQGGRTLRPERRSVIFEVVTRLVFHVMLAASLYLLFAGHNQPGRRLRGWSGGRPRPRDPLSRWRTLRARRGGPLRRRAPRRTRPARRRRLGAGPARFRRDDPRDDRPGLRAADLGRGAPGHLPLLRRRRLPHRRGDDARHRPQSRHRHRPPHRRGRPTRAPLRRRRSPAGAATPPDAAPAGTPRRGRLRRGGCPRWSGGEAAP